MRTIVIVVIIIGLLLIQSVSASTQPLGKWDNGPSFDIAAANGYLLVGAGEQVRIYDISTKEKIESIAFEPVRLFNGYSDVGTFRERTPPVKILHTDAGIIQGLYVSGSYLYIIGEKRFVIADISNPASASIVSSLAIGGRDVHVQGNYAYVTGGSKITVIDVTDKSNPFPAAYINLNEDVRRLYISGNYLLTGGNSIFLYIYDISDPLHPSLLGTWADPYSDPRRSVSSVAVSGSYAYVVDYHYGMHVIDISNPANPVEVNSVIGQNEPNANDIKVFGRYLFLSTRYEGFRVYDISNPANPTLVAVFSDFPGYVEGIYVYQTGYGLYVFETGYSTGWAIVDASDVENPTLLAKIPVPTCDSVVVRGNYAFYGGHNDGVWVVDVSDPSNPHEVIMIKNKGRNTGLAIDGDYLYIAGSWSELTIADISNPEDPVITVWDFGGDIGGEMMVIDNYLYAGGVKIFDVSDKHNPRLVYSADLGFGRGAQPLARYGDYLIFGGQNGLFVVDVSDRTNPVVVGQYNLDMYTGDAEVVGNVVFAVEGSGNLYAIDISNPANPVLLDSTTGIIANKIAVYGSMAYLLPRISTWGGLRVVDVSDPENLKLVESLEGVYGNDMAESDGILYTSEGHIISTGQIEVPLTISMVNVGNITQDSAVVTWQTNKDADSLVEYGTVSGRYTESIYDSGLTKYHTLTLTGLNPGTTYYLRVTSVAGTETVTSQEVTFKTQAKSGDTSVQPADKIYPEKDARISPITRWNNGNAELIVGSHDRYRTVMEFTLPDGMGEIKSVKLYLYVESTEYSNYNHTIELYTLENAFDENAVNWTHRTASEEWDNPGGDLGILIDHYNATGDLSGTWISFTLKGGGADNPLNLSWGDTVRLILVQKVTGDWHNKYRYDRFDSREGENRPYLVVETV